MKLFRFFVDYGRMGELHGLFLAEEEAVNSLVGKNIYFGEVLGKHSDVDITIEEKDIELINVSQATIDDLYANFGADISGYNPLNCVREYED